MRGRLVSCNWQHDPTLYAPPRHRRACRYEAFVPERIAGVTLSLDSWVASGISEAESAIHRLNTVARPALAPLARLFLRTESIASSKVEGLQMGARELARAEARLEAGGRAGALTHEILGNIDAMELAILEATEADRFGTAEISAIHERLMERSADPRGAGRIRTVQNWIGGNDFNPCGADFVPPPPEEVDDLLADLCRAVEDDSLPPILQAALVHAQFETIHPFEDGNGRTGRALIHVVLRRRGVAPDYVPPISVMLAAERDRYLDGLTAFRFGEIDTWLERFAAAATRSAKLATAYLEAVRDLTEVWRARLASARAPRADAAAWAVIDVLPAHPVITTPVAVAATGRAKSAVHQAVADLEDAGVLIPLSQARRNRAWEADGLLGLLARMEVGEWPEEV
jgi:Fic family protein